MKVLAHQGSAFFLIVDTKNTRTLIINNDLKSVYYMRFYNVNNLIYYKLFCEITLI